MKNLLVAAIGLLSTAAFSADQFGNGGDAIVCEDRQPSVLLYDFVEAPLLYDHEINLPAGGNWKDIAEKTLSIIENIDPTRHALYSTWLQAFETETKFVDGNLEDIPDSNHWVIPAGCELRQIAIQKTPDLSRYRYFIDQDLWEAMDPMNQAGLVMHELFYREAAEMLGHNNSRNTRYFMTFIASNETMTLQEYNSAAHRSDFFVPENPFNLFLQGYQDTFSIDVWRQAEAIAVVDRKIFLLVKTEQSKEVDIYNSAGDLLETIPTEEGWVLKSIWQGNKLILGILESDRTIRLDCLSCENGKRWSKEFEINTYFLHKTPLNGVVLHIVRNTHTGPHSTFLSIDDQGRVTSEVNDTHQWENHYIGSDKYGADYFAAREYAGDTHALRKFKNGLVQWTRYEFDSRGYMLDDRVVMKNPYLSSEFMGFTSIDLNGREVDSFEISEHIGDQIIGSKTSLIAYGSSMRRTYMSSHGSMGELNWVHQHSFGLDISRPDYLDSSFDHLDNLVLRGTSIGSTEKIVKLVHAESGLLVGNSRDISEGCAIQMAFDDTIQAALLSCDGEYRFVRQKIKTFNY